MKVLFTSLRLFLYLTFVTGIAYPFFITLIAKGRMKPNLIAQKFEKEIYFWPRPSAIDYNPLPSGGSNLGPTSRLLNETVEARNRELAKTHGVPIENVPSELVYASGSGLDPHISLAGAYFQMERVAKARGMDQMIIEKLVNSLMEKHPPRINVLLLNMALDQLN